MLGLAAQQRACGHAVRVIAVLSEEDDRHPFTVALRDSGVHVDELVLPGRQYRRERAQVREILHDARVQVAHTHGYRPDVNDAGTARAAGVATISTVHGFTGGNLRNRIYERLQVAAYGRFDAVVAVSRPLRVLLERRGVPAARLHVIQNALRSIPDRLDRDAARNVLALPQNAFVVGWVGRMTPEKGADVMIDAVTRLAPIAGPLVFVMMGDGPQRGTLESRTAGVSGDVEVRWLGTVPDAGRLYRAFDLFVLSSRTEGTPMALLEAMSAEVPAVATSVGGVPEIISEREGWLVSSEDPDSMARAIAEAVGSPAVLSARGAAAGERVRTQFDVARWAERYEAVYRAIIR